MIARGYELKQLARHDDAAYRRARLLSGERQGLAALPVRERIDRGVEVADGIRETRQGEQLELSVHHQAAASGRLRRRASVDAAVR